MNQATTRPLSDKTGQRLFFAQQHEPRPRLFCPVCKTKSMAWSERTPRVRSTRLFLRKSTGFLWPVRACEAVFSPGWGSDPHQAPKSRIRPHKGKVEKSPDKSTGRGVKKKQVKGCGSVNRPTPSSQRPAEPVASGFFPGVNFPVFMGQFWSLGVKPWVREQENPGIPGKIRGSNCGFGPKSEGEKAYDRTEIPCARKA